MGRTGSVVGIGVAEMGVAWWTWKGNISAHYRIATAIGSKVIHRIFFSISPQSKCLVA